MVDRTTGMFYVQVYAERLRLAAMVLDDLQLRVLVYLVARSDEVAITYPGCVRIGEDLAIRPETVMTVIDELAACGWVGFARRGERDMLTNRQLPNVYQISLELMAINPEHVDRAHAIASTAFQQTLFPMYDSKISLIRETVSTDRSHHQEHHQKAPTGSTVRSTVSEAPHAFKKGVQAANDSRRINGASDNGAKTDTTNYYQPLASEAAESLAERIYHATAEHGKAVTNMAAARRLVARYGQHCESALTRLMALRHDKPDYKIRDAMALVTKFAQGAEQAQQHTGSSSYVSGELAQFINH